MSNEKKAAKARDGAQWYTPKDVIKVMHAALFTPRSDDRWGLTIVFKSVPGVGKTSRTKQVAAQSRILFELLALGERGEGALGVTPVPRTLGSGEMVMGYPPPDWSMQFGDKAGFVFLDECNQLPPALKPYILGLLLDARIGGKFLGNRVRIMGAMNPVEISAGGWEETAPEANRHGHLYWPTPNEEEWSEWLMSGGAQTAVGTTPEAEEARVMALWPSAYAKACGLVSTFVKRNPNKLLAMPEVGSPGISGPWPSPRTCEMATRALASAEIHGLSEDDTDTFVASFVGRGWADEFYSFRQSMDLPDPAELLDGKVKWKHDPTRVDVTSVVLASCAGLVTPEKAQRRKERATALWQILESVLGDAKDEVVGPTRALCNAKLSRGFPEAIEVLSELADVLKAAGITA